MSEQNKSQESTHANEQQINYMPGEPRFKNDEVDSNEEHMILHIQWVKNRLLHMNFVMREWDGRIPDQNLQTEYELLLQEADRLNIPTEYETLMKDVASTSVSDREVLK